MDDENSVDTVGSFPLRVLIPINAFIASFDHYHIRFDLDRENNKIYIKGNVTYDPNMNNQDDDDTSNYQIISDLETDPESEMVETDTSSTIKQETDPDEDDDSYEGITYNDVSCLCFDPVPDATISNADVRMIDMKQVKQELMESEESNTDNDEDGDTYMSSDGATFSGPDPPGPNYNIVYHNDASSILSMLAKEQQVDSHGERQLLKELDQGCSAVLLDELIPSDDEAYLPSTKPTATYASANTLHKTEATPWNMDVCFVAVSTVENQSLKNAASLKSPPDILDNSLTNSTEHSLSTKDSSFASACSHPLPLTTENHTLKHGEDGGIFDSKQGIQNEKPGIRNGQPLRTQNTKTLNPDSKKRTNYKSDIPFYSHQRTENTYIRANRKNTNWKPFADFEMHLLQKHGTFATSHRPWAERFTDKPYGKRTVITLNGQTPKRQVNPKKQHQNETRNQTRTNRNKKPNFNASPDGWIPVTNRQRRVQYQGLRYQGTKQERDPIPKNLNRGTPKNTSPGIPKSKNSRNLGDTRRYRTPGDPLFRAQGEPWIPRQSAKPQGPRQCMQKESTDNTIQKRPVCQHRQEEKPKQGKTYSQNTVYQRLEKKMNQKTTKEVAEPIQNSH